MEKRNDQFRRVLEVLRILGCRSMTVAEIRRELKGDVGINVTVRTVSRDVNCLVLACMAKRVGVRKRLGGKAHVPRRISQTKLKARE